MKNFIEVTTVNGKRLVNINTISVVNETENGKTSLVLLSLGEGNGSRTMAVHESYTDIKNLIQESL